MSQQNGTQRKYKIGIYGATGYTGERIALYLAHLQVTDKFKHTFVIAGRDTKKLQGVHGRITSQLGRYDISKIKLEVIGGVNTNDSDALKRLTEQCTVLISAAGPYRFLGPPVVDACVATKTNYVDVTGEPEFIEKMIVEYDDKAKQAGITIVHACGFDSVPSDMGCQYTEQQFKKAYGNDAVVSHIDTLISVWSGEAGTAANTGTWYSLVHGLSGSKTLQTVRKQLKQKYQAAGADVKRIGRASKPKPFYYDKRAGRWAILFPGADAAIVRNTQQQLAILGEKDVVQPHFAISFTVSSIIYLALFAVFGTVLKIMAQWKIGKHLLLKYPTLFSFGAFKSTGPTAAQLDQTSFTMDWYARGYKSAPADSNARPDLQLHARMSAPEPGYRFTPIAVVQSALTVLEYTQDKKRAGSVPSGVLTPGVAFKKTDLIDRLQAVDSIQFKVIEDKKSK